MEILLDPRSIQWFLAFGGGLFVLGLVLFLYTKGIFENPGTVAVCLGGANLAVSWAAGPCCLRLVINSRVGRDVAGVPGIMPLNLWSTTRKT